MELFSGEPLLVCLPELKLTLQIICPCSAISADHKFFCRAMGVAGGSALFRIHHTEPWSIIFSDDQYGYQSTSIKSRMLWRSRVMHGFFQSLEFEIHNYSLYTKDQLLEILGKDPPSIWKKQVGERAAAAKAAAAATVRGKKAAKPAPRKRRNKLEIAKAQALLVASVAREHAQSARKEEEEPPPPPPPPPPNPPNQYPRYRSF